MNAKHAAIVALAVLGLPLALPAHAEPGAWKVGASYVIRFEHLDLDQPRDRLALLTQVERSAGKLCEGVRTKVRREACADAAVSSALSAARAEVRMAVQTARIERDSQQQAQR